MNGLVIVWSVVLTAACVLIPLAIIGLDALASGCHP